MSSSLDTRNQALETLAATKISLKKEDNRLENEPFNSKIKKVFFTSALRYLKICNKTWSDKLLHELDAFTVSAAEVMLISIVLVF